MRDWELQLWIIMLLKLGGVAGEVKTPNGFLASVDLRISWTQMIAIFANYKGHEMMTVLPASRILKLKNELQNGMSQILRLEIMYIHLPKMQSSQEQLWCSKLLSSTANNSSQVSQ